MSIKIEIFSDTAATLQRELECLAPLIRTAAEAQRYPDVTVDLRQAIKDAPMDVVRKVVNEVFDAQGFEVAITLREEQATEGAPEAAPKPELTEAAPAKAEPRKRGGRPSLVDSDTAAKRLKGNGANETAAVAEADPIGTVEPTPEADKTFVLDTLGAVIKDPKRKQSALAFAAKMAKANDTDKLTKLTADKFPAIRAEMEKEFPSG